MAQLEAQGKNVSKMFSFGIKSLIGTPESEIKRQLETSESSRVNSLAPKEISPIFTQFLDAVYQIWIQFPQMFEFNEKFLIYINTHIYSGQFGTFLFNSDSQRAAFLKEGKSLKESTYSIWGYMETVEQDILNPIYVSPEMIRNRKIKGKEKSPVGNAPLLPLKTVGTPGSSTEEGTVIFPSSNELKYWLGLFMRNDLDGVEIVDVETLTGSLNSSLNATMGATMKALRSVVDAIDFDDGSTESLVIEEELKKVEKEKVVVRAPSPSRSVSPVKKKEIEMMDMVDL